MDIINGSLNIDPTTKKISITGLKKEVVIDYNLDVDFTELISVLSEHVDNGKEISFSGIPTEFTDDKLKIVINTCNEILAQYNINMLPASTPEATAMDDDLPF